MCVFLFTEHVGVWSSGLSLFWPVIHGIGIHTLLEGVCRHGCQCTHSGVSPAHHVNFPLLSVSFRVAAGRAYCFFLSGDFLRAGGYYDLDAILGRGSGISHINHLVVRHLFW